MDIGTRCIKLHNEYTVWFDCSSLYNSIVLAFSNKKAGTENLVIIYFCMGLRET